MFLPSGYFVLPENNFTVVFWDWQIGNRKPIPWVPAFRKQSGSRDLEALLLSVQVSIYSHSFASRTNQDFLSFALFPWNFSGSPVQELNIWNFSGSPVQELNISLFPPWYLGHSQVQGKESDIIELLFTCTFN